MMSSSGVSLADIHWLAAMAEVGPAGDRGAGGARRLGRGCAWAEQMEDGYWHMVSYHETVEEAEAARRSVEQTGAEVVLSGGVGGTRFYMFDTGSLFGRMFEVAGGDLSAVSWTGEDT